MSYRCKVLETASYAITLAYAYRNDFPFSTYGENLFLSVQNVVITLLIIWFAPTAQKILSGSGGRVRTHGNVTGVLAGLATTVVVAVFLSSRKLCPPATCKFCDSGRDLSMLQLTAKLSTSITPPSEHCAPCANLESSSNHLQPPPPKHRQPLRIRRVQRLCRLSCPFIHDQSGNG